MSRVQDRESRARVFEGRALATISGATAASPRFAWSKQQTSTCPLALDSRPWTLDSSSIHLMVMVGVHLLALRA